jgi:hypothetical protein
MYTYFPADVFRVFTIKYEDMVANMKETFAEIFKFVDLPMRNEVFEAIDNHTATDMYSPSGQIEVVNLMEKIAQPKLTKPRASFSTFRNLTNFDPNHWQTELDPKVLDGVRKSADCHTLFDKMRYKMVAKLSNDKKKTAST